MSIRLLLLLCLTEYVFTKQLPDVDCVVMHLKYVQCFWNKLGTPQSNYTFYGWFHNEKQAICTSYLSEEGINIGCNLPHTNLMASRFLTFYTRLEDGNNSRSQEHALQHKVILYPPTNLTVQIESDLNLWLYWNQTNTMHVQCMESEVRYRINDKEWDTTTVSIAKQNYCINLPCNNCRYEVQVRRRIGNKCEKSEFWSNWSEPVVWGFNSNTDKDQINSMTVWTPVLIVVGSITTILLVMMLLHHERLRIILIPRVPKPALIPRDIEDWFEHSKGLKDSFKPNYNEHACTVREYTHVSQSDSESSVSSTSSVTTDQYNCSVLISADEPDPAPLTAPEF